MLEYRLFTIREFNVLAYFVGAYASSPNISGWDAELEKKFYDQLKLLPNIKGLEHPFAGQLHGYDDDWFLSNIDPNWDFVFTCAPGTMGGLSRNPQFGLASDDEQGRQQALVFMQKARDAIEKLNHHSGRNTVAAIEIQTAPNQSAVSSSKKALLASLTTILEWDWHGAQILIEHCDTLVEGQIPSKGFLSIEDEVEVLNTLNRQLDEPLGLVINWGRSVLETRRCEGALEHIKLAQANGLLQGLMFSGVSDQDSEYGAWRDTHVPAAKFDDNAFGVEHSLMTESEIHRCLAACNGELPPFLGIKIGVRPVETSVDERVAYNRDTLAILDRYSR
ncbi:MAG: hypothetical protein ACI88A_001353 [Paraglaciecola sp.]